MCVWQPSADKYNFFFLHLPTLYIVFVKLNPEPFLHTERTPSCARAVDHCLSVWIWWSFSLDRLLVLSPVHAQHWSRSWQQSVSAAATLVKYSHTLDSTIIHLVGFEQELVCLCVTEQQAPASALPTQTAVGEMKVQDNIYLGGGSCSITVSRMVQSDIINTGALNNVVPELIQHRARYPIYR